MKKCPKCGEKIFIDNIDIETCSICGAKLIEEKEEHEQPKTKYTERIKEGLPSWDDIGGLDDIKELRGLDLDVKRV